MNSPPMTPPEPDICENMTKNTDATRRRSLLELSAQPLETQVSKLRDQKEKVLALCQDLLTGVTHQDDLSPLIANSLDFVRCAMLLLEEIDPKNDIRYAQENLDSLTAVETAVDDVELQLRTRMPLMECISQDPNDTTTGWESMYAELQYDRVRVKSSIQELKLQYLAVNDWNDCQESLRAIQDELRELKSSIYTMQEQRHIALNPAVSLELDVLVTILEDPPEGENTGTPGKKVNEDGLSKWDRALSESMTRLTSKLSPLRTSLEMFGQRIESFTSRACDHFPSAIQKLNDRYAQLKDELEEVVEKFATLRQELGEDKWLAVYRQVNKQATEMMDSLRRTLKKLDTTVFTSPEAERLAETFEMKAEHYGKSIPAILSIMCRGVKDRLTLNGEVIRGYDVLTQKWAQLSIDIADMTRRIRGAKAAGLIQTDDQIISQKTRSNKIFATSRKTLRSQSRHSEIDTCRTPQLQWGTGHDSRMTQRNVSALSFRKDTSLDPPRSRSRLSNAREISSNIKSRPPWNGGTVARLIDSNALSVVSSPLRTLSRCTSRTGLANAQLDRINNISHIPSNKARDSLLPQKAGLMSTGKARPSLGLPKSDMRFLNEVSTPSKVRDGIIRPKTPTSIPVARRMVSNAQSMLPTPSKPRTASGLHSSVNSHTISERAPSAMSGRRQSNIPLPSPHKQMIR